MWGLMAATMALLMLTGCIAPMTPIPYRHPVTGRIATCHRPPPFLLGDGSIVTAVVQGNRFADCKTALEARGFLREGASE